MGTEEEAPLALHSWARANANYYACKAKCGWSNKPCKAVCLTKYNDEYDKSTAVALFETTPEEASLALHGYVEGNAAYYACKAKCGFRASKECKESCLDQYKVNRADGKLILSSIESLQSSESEDVETLALVGLDEDAGLSLMNYYKANKKFFKCSAYCYSTYCKTKCLKKYRKNISSKHLALSTEVSNEDSLDMYSFIGTEEEAPLALHSWARANANYYGCKVKCGWSNKTCKAVCLTKYNDEVDKNTAVALFEDSDSQESTSLALHGYVEGNAAYYACRAKCGVRATKECKESCLTQYKANRADGKVVLSSLESLVANDDDFETLAMVGLEGDEDIFSFSSYYKA
jgi:hypothetical protein